ncbi:hypothetical protein DF060_24240 [Burkholderia pseudomallei]|nr:hypothetical protein DF127_23100 [Burkholderia pseudomallei]RPE20047.1 hypothetical protein DF068_20800 [Burkholderia pseudomallei]RQS89234.1 hypothetical protein DF125_21795 [Burkholderia pseudomallei]RQZ48805.1 hypothetical protein DF060_24240 [Burkholderia pseudomallei]
MGCSLANTKITAALTRTRNSGASVSVRVVPDRSDKRSTYNGATYLTTVGSAPELISGVRFEHQKIIVPYDVTAYGSMNFA